MIVQASGHTLLEVGPSFLKFALSVLLFAFLNSEGFLGRSIFSEKCRAGKREGQTVL